jgi:signal transduction histidine kinase
VVKVDHPAKLSVIDSGPGLRSNELDVLFEPFKRGDTKADGTGIGLAIVAQVMTAHHGSIAVRETPGGGTTIDLSFSAEGTAIMSCPNGSALVPQDL